jgi:hypothetical protein
MGGGEEDGENARKERTMHHVPVRCSHLGEYTLILLGALTVARALFITFMSFDGVTPYLDWVMRNFAAVRMSVWAVGGLMLTAGFGLYARRTKGEDSHWSKRAITGTTLALLALLVAVIAVVGLIF